jgi:hypothetical protein
MMKFITTYENLDDYLLVSIRGEWTEYAAKEVIEEIQSKAKSYGKVRVLLNLMDMTPPRPRQEIVRFMTGKYMAEFWGHSLKVAGVWKQEFINKFAENVAVNRGVRLAVFADEKEALKWLLAG